MDPLLGVEPRHLATFVAVAEAGSFRRAAPRLGYAPSAVSQQIAVLERALRARLIERGHANRILAFTEDGHALLDHARHVVDQLRAARADLACLGRDGPLQVAVEPAAAGLLSGLIRAMGPALSLSVSEMPADVQVELAKHDALDLAVGHFPGLDRGLASHVLRTDEWMLVTPAQSALPLLVSTPVSPECLRGLRLIEERSHPLPFRPLRLEAETVMSCDRIATALELVRAGAGCAIVPGLAVDGGDERLHVVSLAGLLPPRPISVVWCRRRRLPGRLAAAVVAAAGEAVNQPEPLETAAAAA